MTPTPDDRTLSVALPDAEHTLTHADVSSSFAPVAAPPGYTLEQELGRGGMGLVYLARQHGLNRPVALKMVLSNDATSSVRFLAEAELMAALKHPHVVEVYQFGEHQGRPFLALEYCEGGSLDQQIQAKQVRSHRQVAELMLAIAQGVAAAHALGIVHRDLKPHNVLLTASGVAKVTDFGLAKRANQAALTQTNAVMGTPAYMPPEQANGATKFAGPQADVWALGVMLYELLTGVRPFDGADHWQVLAAVMRGSFTLPRQRDRHIPRDLELICLKCMRVAPTERYATANELADDLQRWLDGKPIHARPAGTMQTLVKWAARNKVVATAMCVTALALLAGTAVSLWYGHTAQQAATQAHDNLGQAQIQRQRADDNAKQATANLQLAERREQDEKAAKKAALAEQAKALAEQAKALEQLKRAEQLIYANKLALAQVAHAENRLPQALKYLEECQWDLRGWEHRHLWTRFNAPQQIIGHAERINRVAYRPDGKQLVTASADRTVRLWHAETGQLLRTLPDHNANVLVVAYRPDGQQFLSAGADKVVRLWNADGERVHTLEGHTKGITAAVWSPDGTLIATGGEDRTVRLWDAAAGKLLHTFADTHQSNYLVVAFHPQGHELLSGGDRKLRLWNIAERKERANFDAKHFVSCLAYTPDGREIVTGGTDAVIRVFNPTTGAVRLALPSNHGNLTAVALRPDGWMLASSCRDGLVKVWNMESGKELYSFTIPSHHVGCLTYSPDGRRLATGCLDHTLHIWDVARTTVPILRGHSSTVHSTAFLPDSQHLVTASTDRRLKIWTVAHGYEAFSAEVSAQTCTAMALSKDGRTVVVGSDDGGVNVFALSADGGRWQLPKKYTLTPHRDRVETVAISADGQYFASGSQDKTITVWSLATGQLVATLTGHRERLQQVAFHPDGKQLVSASLDGTVRTWNIAEQKEVLQFFGDALMMCCLAFDPTGPRLATGDGDNNIRIWASTRGAELLLLRGHTARVTKVCFSPDGTRLFSASQDKTIKVWDARTGQELLTLKGHGNSVFDVCLSPDGRHLASGSYDNTACLWRVDAEARTTRLFGHYSNVVDLSFSPNGRWLASRSMDKVARVWDMTTGHNTHTVKGQQTAITVDDAGQLIPNQNTKKPPLRTTFGTTTVDARSPILMVTNTAVPEPSSWPAPERPERERYHTAQAAAAQLAKRWFAAAFHLRRLLLDAPEDASLQQRLAEVLAPLAKE